MLVPSPRADVKFFLYPHKNDVHVGGDVAACFICQQKPRGHVGAFDFAPHGGVFVLAHRCARNSVKIISFIFYPRESAGVAASRVTRVKSRDF